MVYQLETIENNMQPICNQMTTIGIPKDSQKIIKNRFFNTCIPVLTMDLIDVIVPLNFGIPMEDKMETQYR